MSHMKNFQYPKELMHNLDLIEDSFSNLKKILYRDIFYCKLPRILRSCDRASMANSLEIRSPFLDPDLVSFAWKLPDNYISKGGEKSILKSILVEKISSQIVYRKKLLLYNRKRKKTWQYKNYLILLQIILQH